MYKAMEFAFACVVCTCFLCSLVGCRSDRVEWSYASLADVKKADAGAQSWVPDDLLPASAHSIRIAGELSPSYEWGSFDFVPADSQAIVNSLRSVDVLPQSVKSVRSPRVSWWPSLLTGTLNVEKIRAAGFQLFAVEKPANSVDNTVFLLKSGYDHFYGFRGGAVDYFSHAGARGKEDFWDGDVPIHQTGYLTDLLGSRAVEIVNGYAKSGQPFLVSLHFNAPHWPWEGPGDEAESKRLSQPGSGGLSSFDSGSQKIYQKMIEDMDRQIGRVLQAVEANGLTKNTIVIFTSDNGGERFADTWPFTGKKTELLEGGLRIPAVISWPGHIPHGETTDQVSISMDWMPTLLGAAGAEPDRAYPTDGLNLLPILTQNAAPIPRKLFWRYKANAQRAVRDGNLKFLKILDNTFLFNVVEDPLERANLKDRQKEDYRRLVREWYDWNASMLPEIKESFTAGFDGEQLADHFGAKEPDGKPDIPSPPDD